MTSYRQIEANRRDALKSTGPRTDCALQCCAAWAHGRDSHWCTLCSGRNQPARCALRRVLELKNVIYCLRFTGIRVRFIAAILLAQQAFDLQCSRRNFSALT